MVRIACAAALIGGAFAAQVAAADDYRDCFCPVSRAGANVDVSRIGNASICSNTNLGHERCNTMVLCLDDGVTGPDCPSHPEKTGTDVGTLFETLPRLAESHAEKSDEGLPFPIENLTKAIEVNTEAFQSCLDVFAGVIEASAEVPVASVEQPFEPQGAPLKEGSFDGTFCGVTTFGTLYFGFSAEALDASGSSFRWIDFQFTRPGR